MEDWYSSSAIGSTMGRWRKVMWVADAAARDWM